MNTKQLLEEILKIVSKKKTASEKHCGIGWSGVK